MVLTTFVGEGGNQLNVVVCFDAVSKREVGQNNYVWMFLFGRQKEGFRRRRSGGSISPVRTLTFSCHATYAEVHAIV